MANTIFEFKICDVEFNKTGYFLYETGRDDHTHPISYRLVIFYCIYQYIKSKYKNISEENKDDIKEDIAKKLKEAHKSLNENNGSFFEEGLFAFYIFHVDDEKGAVLIDRTEGEKGVFPLVLYPDEYKIKGNNKLSEGRFGALCSAINEAWGNWGVKKKYFQNVIFPALLQKENEWSRSIQIELGKYFDLQHPPTE